MIGKGQAVEIILEKDLFWKAVSEGEATKGRNAMGGYRKQIKRRLMSNCSGRRGTDRSGRGDEWTSTGEGNQPLAEGKGKGRGVYDGM